MTGTIAETMQTVTKMLTLGLNTMLKIMFRTKVSIFVKVWVVSAIVPLTPNPWNSYAVSVVLYSIPTCHLLILLKPLSNGNF